MIDEKKLIEKIEYMIGMLPTYYINKKDEENAYLDAINRVLSAVKRQPKVGEWIPVEEGLPKVGQDILATCSNGEVDAGFYGWNDDWNLDYIDIEAHPVIAWMPFPEQYRKEDNK